jgi:hypothetical protein
MGNKLNLKIKLKKPLRRPKRKQEGNNKKSCKIGILITYTSASKQGIVGAFYEDGNEPTGSITVGKSFTTSRIRKFSQKNEVSLREQKRCEKNRIPKSRSVFIPPGVLAVCTRSFVAPSKRR